MLKSVLTARQHSILHPERVVGNPRVVGISGSSGLPARFERFPFDKTHPPGSLAIRMMLRPNRAHRPSLQSPLIAGTIETSAPAGTAVGRTRQSKLSAVNKTTDEYLDTEGAD